MGFTIAELLVPKGANVMISCWKQHNVARAASVLQRHGMSDMGTACHAGKAQNQEQLVAAVRGQGTQGHREENMPILFITA